MKRWINEWIFFCLKKSIYFSKPSLNAAGIPSATDCHRAASPFRRIQRIFPRIFFIYETRKSRNLNIMAIILGTAPSGAADLRQRLSTSHDEGSPRPTSTSTQVEPEAIIV